MDSGGGSPLKTLGFQGPALTLLWATCWDINVQPGKHRVFNGLWGVGCIENYVRAPTENQWTIMLLMLSLWHRFPSAIFCPQGLSKNMLANPFLKVAKQLSTPVKKKEEVKGEDFTPTPVAAKKACTTFERWVKKQEGDTSLLRDALTQDYCFSGSLHYMILQAI